MAQTGKTRAFLKSEAYQQLEILKKQKLQVYANVAVMASMVACARHRTAAFARIRKVETIQAFCVARLSQVVFRTKDYAARKDIIFMQVRALLKFQGDEDVYRKAVVQEQDEEFAEMLEREREGLKALEAKWWAGKPARDEAMQRLLYDEEHEQRAAIMAPTSQPPQTYGGDDSNPTALQAPPNPTPAPARLLAATVEEAMELLLHSHKP